MDEGRAALYAAIIGFAAAIIGAAVGGWASWRAAKHGADAAVRAVVEQVRGQARNEEIHWIRQERRQLYGKVTAAQNEFVAALHAWKHTSEPLESPLYDDVENAWRHLAEACHELHVFGPDDVSQAAFAIMNAAGEVMTSAIAQASLDTGQGDPEMFEAAASAGHWEHAMRTAQSSFTLAVRSTFTGDLPQPPAV